MSLFDVGTMTELLNRSLTGGVVILAVHSGPGGFQSVSGGGTAPTGRCGGGWKARHGHGPPAVHRTGAGGFGCQ